jgi:hypothetical protein
MTAASRHRREADIFPDTTAILNGFGRTLGDSLIGLQALSIALELHTVTRHPLLWRVGVSSSIIRELYRAAGDFASVRELPQGLEKPGRLPPGVPPAAIDLREFAFDPGFRDTAMIDFFLERLGVDPACVPSGRKRNSWLAPRVRPIPPREAEPGYVLLCPDASMRLRSMPTPIHDAIIRWFGRHTRRTVLTQATRPDEASLAHLCGLVASAALVISTDTAMVHLADAFSVPCLAFFPTHQPELRVRDYPRCRAVTLVARELPRSLEFSRGVADEAAASAAWFRDGADLGWLDDLLATTVMEPSMRLL